MDTNTFYEDISRAESNRDYSGLEKIREELFNLEWQFVVMRTTASVKEKIEINLNLSELQNNIVHASMAMWRLRDFN